MFIGAIFHSNSRSVSFIANTKNDSASHHLFNFNGLKISSLETAGLPLLTGLLEELEKLQKQPFTNCRLEKLGNSIFSAKTGWKSWIFVNFNFLHQRWKIKFVFGWISVIFCESWKTKWKLTSYISGNSELFLRHKMCWKIVPLNYSFDILLR